MKGFTEFYKRITEELNNKPKSTKILYLVITIILPLAIFYNFYYTPKKEKEKNLVQTIESLDKEILKYEQIAKKEKELEFIVKERRKFLEESQKILPTEKEIPILLNNIAQLAKKRGLKVLQFVPKPEIQKNYYNEIPIELSFTGSFNNTFAFLNDVENLERLVNLISVEITQQDKDTLLTKSTFYTFKYTGVELKPQGKK
ncbi:MAG: type 4a pilus biogenesis protein PilO [Caldimicrobium sp.]|jgi:type IV pilus assembly protein PilO|nr:type 4a pilus biogenesis protein PilO [Caldimicrobium sp.]